MPNATTLRLATVLYLSTALFACGDSGSPTAPAGPTPPPDPTPVATTLRVADSTITLQVPRTATVTARVYDQTGAVMPSLVPTWMSRDSTTASVTSDGTVAAVETGDTWLVATSGGLTDSVLVRVRFPVGDGEARLRTRGPDAEHLRLMSPVGSLYDFVGTDTLDRADLEFDGSDTYVVVGAEPPSSAGEESIEAWSIQALLDGATIVELPAPGAFVVDVNQGVTAYVGESGYLAFTDVEVAEDTARLAGHLHLRAVAYDLSGVDFNNPTVPSPGDTVTCDLDFDVSASREQVGYAIVRFDGGPMGSSQDFWDAYVGWPNVNPPGTPLIELKVQSDATLTVPLYDPQPGALSILAQDPNGSYTAGSGFTTLWMTGYDPYFLASGQGGSIALTTIDWPQTPSSGQLSGTIDASVLYWLQGDPQNAETGTLNVEFHALWPPRPSTDAAAPTVESRSPWHAAFRWDAGSDAAPGRPMAPGGSPDSGGAGTRARSGGVRPRPAGSPARRYRDCNRHR